MDNSNVNIDLIRGHVDTIILKSLYYEDKYGYEILNEIKEKSKGMYTLKQPTLYSCLKRLEKQGYIRSYKGDTSNGAQRVYYSLQPAGRAFLESDQHQWEFSRTIIDSLLSSEEFDPEKHVAPFDPSNFRPLTRRNRTGSDGDFDDAEVHLPVSSDKSSEEDFVPSADEMYIPPETVAPPVDEYDNIPHEYIGTTYPEERTVAPSDGGYKPYYGEFTGIKDYTGNPSTDGQREVTADKYNNAESSYSQVQSENSESEELNSFDNDEARFEDYTVSDENISSDSYEESEDEGQIEEYDAPAAQTQPLFYGDERSEENTEENEAKVKDDYTTVGKYTAYVAGKDDVDSQVKDEAFGKLYEKKPVEEAKPEFKTYNTDVTADNRYDDYSNRQTINYIDSFDSIYNVPMTQVTPSSSSGVSSSDDEKINYLSTSELKSKMMAEGYNLRPYVKKNTSEYYINQYYFSNKLNRDSSVITYLIYAIGVLIAYFSTAPKFGHNVGALFGFLALGLLYPIVMFVAFCVDPKKRIKANFNAKNALINSLIVIVNAIILIVLIGFLACGARIDNIDSMIRPVIIPLVFLLIIPISIMIYYWLYKSNHYHVN